MMCVVLALHATMQEECVQRLCISRSQRTKRKSVTVVVGLRTFGKAIIIVTVQSCPV